MPRQYSNSDGHFTFTGFIWKLCFRGLQRKNCVRYFHHPYTFRTSLTFHQFYLIKPVMCSIIGWLHITSCRNKSFNNIKLHFETDPHLLFYGSTFGVVKRLFGFWGLQGKPKAMRSPKPRRPTECGIPTTQQHPLAFCKDWNLTGTKISEMLFDATKTRDEDGILLIWESSINYPQ